MTKIGFSILAGFCQYLEAPIEQLEIGDEPDTKDGLNLR